MIGLLTGLGLAPRAAKAIAYVVVPLLVVALLWAALSAYGDARYRAGKSDADRAWQAASERLRVKAAVSAEMADDKAEQAVVEHTAKVAAEKEKIDAAIAAGDSPFNVLFPAGGVPAEAGR